MRTKRLLIAATVFFASAVTIPAQWIKTGTYVVPGTGDLNGITTGPDGALWICQNSGAIIRLTTSGVATVYTLPNGSALPEEITTGPDNALWFSTLGTTIGRITTDGSSSFFSVTSGGTMGITSGPDGALWFTYSALPSGVGRITTAGEVTLYPISGFGPESITTGSDGALWFTEFSSNRIGRITTGGVITEYSTPTAGNPLGIAPGSDGNLWYTYQSAGLIGRVTTAGIFTEFPAPNGLQGITAAPDGALWFSGNNFGRVTTSGLVTAYAVPPAMERSNYIDIGPDNEVWVTSNLSTTLAHAPICAVGLQISLVKETLTTNMAVSTIPGGTVKASLETVNGIKKVYSQAFGPTPAPVPVSFEEQVNPLTGTKGIEAGVLSPSGVPQCAQGAFTN